MRCFCAGLLLATAAAARPQAPAVSGLVRTPAGDAAPSAEVLYVPAPSLGLPWLAPALPAPPPRTTATDGGGEFALPAEHPGVLLVRDAGRGLGALRTDVAPGVPLRVALHPLATVAVAGAPATVDVVAVGAGGEGVLLRRGLPAPLRLPPGRYRLLVRSERGIAATSVSLRARQSLELPEPPVSAPRLWLPGDRPTRVFVAGWTGAPLPRAGGAVLGPPGPLALRLEIDTEHGTLHAASWLAAGATAAPDLPPAEAWESLRVSAAEGTPVQGATVLGVGLDPGGPRVVSSAVTGADGGAAVLVRGAEARVLVHARGRALQLLPPPLRDAGAEVVLEPGWGVEISVRTEGGAELPGAPVALRHEGLPGLLFETVTDGRGRARFEDLPAGNAELSLRSSRHVPVQRSIRIEEAAEGHPWSLLAAQGLALEGRVEGPGGEAVAGAVVTLRDTTGLLGQPPRTTVSGPDGSFAFEGLLPEELCTLSAVVERDGRTMSGQVRAAQPGGGVDWLLVVEPEDPEPPRPRDRDRRQ